MRPQNLQTKIFLDSGDPEETREVMGLLGFLDGQTTNPTLISKNPDAKKRLASGKRFTQEEVLNFYRNVVYEVSRLIPEGSISIEVYADKNTTSDEMLAQGKEFFSWIPGAHIKFPTTREGLAVAEQAGKEGIRVNMTLCFSQEQAAAVYAATRGAARPSVYVSPFIGRLDDRGENGMDVVKNIIQMFQKGDGHVDVLTASVRNLNQLLYAIQLQSDIVTAPFQVLKEWAETELRMPDENFAYNPANLTPILYKEISLDKSWQEYNTSHELTDIGLEKFSADWNALVRR